MYVYIIIIIFTDGIKFRGIGSGYLRVRYSTSLIFFEDPRPAPRRILPNFCQSIFRVAADRQLRLFSLFIISSLPILVPSFAKNFFLSLFNFFFFIFLLSLLLP